MKLISGAYPLGPIRGAAADERQRLRILIYGLNYSPELTGIGKYTGEMASWLAERGHEVRVVTAPPYYPAWRVRDDYRGAWYRIEQGLDQPIVYRTPLYVPSRPTGIKRIIHLVSFMLGSFPVMLRETFWEPEIVFTVEPTFFCAPLALFIAKSAGAAAWLHVQDFEVDAAFELGLLPARVRSTMPRYVSNSFLLLHSTASPAYRSEWSNELRQRASLLIV